MILDYWKNIYRTNENNIKEVWKAETKREYIRKREENLLSENNVRILMENEQGEDLVVWEEGTLEHLDTVSKLNRIIKEMDYPTVEEEEVEKGIKKLKN